MYDGSFYQFSGQFLILLHYWSCFIFQIIDFFSWLLFVYLGASFFCLCLYLCLCLFTTDWLSNGGYEQQLPEANCVKLLLNKGIQLFSESVYYCNPSINILENENDSLRSSEASFIDGDDEDTGM